MDRARTSEMRLIPATWRAVKSFWYDTSGIMLPYVTLMLVVIIGLSVLALDGARRMSLEIQMQSAADALALAGARELDLKSGAINRATNAINNLVTNGISGMGVRPPVTVQSINFYSALPIASAGFGGTTTTSDSSAKFVGVTVALNPATVPTI